ncbi:ribonuclease inhibitor [Mycolicibacterium sp. P1-18]|uniref:barstar family protein n=1 Tax=Mycolicibacterium sp. P1-18 TaxID=2024615 RepID=UPI0011F0F971|nr:barstar family protein [Mycolicibacterium sp. P1-18]KAA0095953.1 ribonuclease inhibitor [Mycolicibacterium sp. P1-18]
MTRTFRIDGRNIHGVEDFYVEIGRAVNGPDGYFGNNLDALADCLRGGFGTPADEPFEFDWQHSDLSRRRLRGTRRGGQPFVDAVRDVFDDVGVTLRLR